MEEIVKYDANTGKKLATGATTTDALGNTFTQGQKVNQADLTPTRPMKFPPPTGQNLGEVILPEITSDTDKEVAKIQAQKTSQENDISSLISQLGVEQGKEAQYITQEGGDLAQKEYDRYSSELEAEKLALRRATEKLQKNQQGLFGGALEQEVSRLERESLSKQADLAILGNAAKGRYDTARDIAKRKVESAIAPLQASLDSKKFIYENNKDLFSKAQLNKLDTLIKADEKKIADQEKELTTIETIKIEAFKNGFKGDFSKVKTVDEALQKAGSYLISPMEKLQMEKLKGDIAKNTAELLAAKEVIGGTTGDPVADIVAGSSRYGDKRLTDSQLEKIQKATTALGGMETLQGLLAQGKDGIDLSGPVTGRLRTLATQLGGDADASAINATIQGLIPTVARGIFGEVGVLTDQDIENYRKTVPNLVATGEQNKLISLVMYDVLSRSLESTLVSNAQNQTNVSGFLTTYQNAKQRINTLKSNLGVIETPPITPVNKVKMENAWMIPFTPEGITNTLNGLAN